MNISYDELMFVLRHSPDDQQVLLDITWEAYPAVQYIMYGRPQEQVYEAALRIGQKKEFDRRYFASVDELSSWLKDIMIGYPLKTEAAIFQRSSGKDCIFGGKFGFITLKQADYCTAKPCAIFVGFHALDFAANQFVLDCFAIVGFDFHNWYGSACIRKRWLALIYSVTLSLPCAAAFTWLNWLSRSPTTVSHTRSCVAIYPAIFSASAGSRLSHAVLALPCQPYPNPPLYCPADERKSNEQPQRHYLDRLPFHGKRAAYGHGQ